MSALVNQARSRVPRIAEAAVERARLTVVPRSVRRAARVPFVTLVSLLLVLGVAGLLFFNTSMQQASFRATAMEQRAAVLAAKEQALQMQLARLRDPQRVAERAERMGMVPPSSPAFIRLSDGAVLGNPTPATSADALRVTPLPTRKPKNLRPSPVIAKAPTVAPTSRHHGAASRSQPAGGGTKAHKSRVARQGSQR